MKIMLSACGWRSGHPLLLTLVLFATACHAQNLPLPPLPYDYNALEPHIDEATMRVHHLSHHQTYTDKLNGALKKLREDPATKHLAKMGVDTLIQHLDDIPESFRKTVRNAGGGYVNHALFFDTMSPNGGGEPEGDFADALRKSFGTFSSFQQMFKVTALETFGSGWAWLVYDVAAAALKVTSSANQDTPAMQPGLIPLLGCDVWEHAYYLKHQSKRAAYIDDWWQVVNWPEVMERYAQATSRSDKEEM